MKDIVIEVASLRRELWILLCCLVAAILVNVGAIIAYDRPWSELFTQIGYTCVVAVFIYIIVWIIRLIILIIKKLFKI